MKMKLSHEWNVEHGQEWDRIDSGGLESDTARKLGQRIARVRFVKQRLCCYGRPVLIITVMHTEFRSENLVVEVH